MMRKERRVKMPEAAVPASAPKVTGRRSVKRRYFWLVIPLSWVLIVAVLEGSLRLAGLGHSSALFVPVDSYSLVDNSEYTRRFYSVYDRPEPVQKSNFFAAEKRAGRLRIFVVGESTAQGYPFQRNHSFSAIAQAALRAAGVDAEVLNIGNSAMTSYYVREALSDVRRYQPDFVAVYAGHNEYYGTPSIFTGGSHWTRLAILHLRRYRTVQAMEAVLSRLLERGTPSQSLMSRRFAEGLFPPDSARDRKVGELFIRNVDAGLNQLLKAGVATAVFEPVSNLVDMPPFREAAADSTESTSPSAAAAASRTPVPGAGLVGEYQLLRQELEEGSWDRDAWLAVKDRDAAPFRARSTLTEMLHRYATTTPEVTWIATAAELEKAAGPAAFSHTFFIDHVHFNFDGQLQLARMLARAVVQEFHPNDESKLVALEAYLANPERVRADIHLTAFWEFEAYTRVASLQTHEPFASMRLPKAAPPVPERVTRNSLFVGGGFVAAIRGEGVDDLFFTALDHYQATGNRDEWIRNMNAYVQVFPGHYQSHLAYAVALLEDDARANIDMAGTYFQSAYRLSGGDPEVVALARQTLFNAGLSAVWTSFEARYLHAE